MYEYISIDRTLNPQPTKDCTKRQVFYYICRIFEYLFVNLCDFFVPRIIICGKRLTISREGRPQDNTQRKQENNNRT